jgi:hypothetical protein
MSGPVAERALPGGTVLAVPFAAFFHGERWHADIALPGIAAASYSPFARLAVARYQPDSIADHHLSPVGYTTYTPVLPDRTLTVSQSGSTIGVAVSGLGPVGPQPNRIDVMLEHCEPPAGVSPASIELTALGGGGDGPAWNQVASATVQTTLGAAAVSLTIPPGLGATRLRVREVERVQLLPAQTGTPGELSERVVFTDTVALPLAGP